MAKSTNAIEGKIIPRPKLIILLAPPSAGGMDMAKQKIRKMMEENLLMSQIIFRMNWIRLPVINQWYSNTNLATLPITHPGT